MDGIIEFIKTTGFYMLIGEFTQYWGNIVMILVSLLLLWLAIKKKFEPLLLIGIAFGMLLTNLPGAEMYHGDLWTAFMKGEIGYGAIMKNGGLQTIFISVLKPVSILALSSSVSVR